MSNKSKPQHQGVAAGLKDPLQPQQPPRYQPPPQPSAGILKSQQNGAAAVLHHHQQQQQQQQHQQQAARLASQVKDAVQSKFAQKIDLPHHTTQNTRVDKTPFGLHPSKSYLPSGIPSPSTAPPGVAAPGTGIPVVGVPTVAANAAALNGQTTAPAPRQRISDEEFLRLGPVEMLKFVRKTESDIARLAAEQHRQIQSLINELRVLKEANQRLSDDNQELRDLCCFLDDDRQKGRKLAREWQRFGRYTASVMRQEVSAYQNKLRQLDNKQQELIKDNLELKELCLYLDEERGGGQRDDGDGSSSSTNADESAPQVTHPHHRMNRHHVSSTFNDQTMQYVRSLEQRVKQLEEDKNILQARAAQSCWPGGPPNNEVWADSQRTPSDDFQLDNRPEAVVRALQVLKVREQLDREAVHDGEKALIREMCNVVWRKLEEGPAQNRH
ncbi:coiled-coil domain-containing protein 85C [Nasonia vitripennis]|uniref:Coiled-coil domain-containing protein 85C n=1 Tax=Nasonia vitripennis TaxID=7425 RepID=A0A7M7G620_NASVI|nr:coiled-coil domain-containing protein 85C [Nasonia vitripennis]